MREIKFRGKRDDTGEWVYGYFVKDPLGKCMIYLQPFAEATKNTYYFVQPETVGQFTGYLTKDGKEIYEGDDISFLVPYRTTQTHTGDNIPNGSYTEPMEPGIKEIEGVVVFSDGCFQIEDNDSDGWHPLTYADIRWDLESIKDAIAWADKYAEWFDDPDEGDLQYLIKEVAKVSDEQGLIEYLNGLVINGNIHDTP